MIENIGQNECKLRKLRITHKLLIQSILKFEFNTLRYNNITWPSLKEICPVVPEK